jgi:hypothetical protein
LIIRSAVLHGLQQIKMSGAKGMRLPNEMVDVRRSAIDLLGLDNTDARALVDRLARSDVIWAFYPGGSESILKWHDVLRNESILGTKQRGSRPKPSTMTGLLVENEIQAELILAALALLRDGEMKEPQIERFATLLAAVQDSDLTVPCEDMNSPGAGRRRLRALRHR